MRTWTLDATAVARAPMLDTRRTAVLSGRPSLLTGQMGHPRATPYDARAVHGPHAHQETADTPSQHMLSRKSGSGMQPQAMVGGAGGKWSAHSRGGERQLRGPQQRTLGDAGWPVTDTIACDDLYVKDSLGCCCV